MTVCCGFPSLQMSGFSVAFLDLVSASVWRASRAGPEGRGHAWGKALHAISCMQRCRWHWSWTNKAGRKRRGHFSWPDLQSWLQARPERARGQEWLWNAILKPIVWKNEAFLCSPLMWLIEMDEAQWALEWQLIGAACDGRNISSSIATYCNCRAFWSIKVSFHHFYGIKMSVNIINYIIYIYKL